MPQSTQTNPLATAYAKSLLELANTKNHAEQIGAELGDIGQVLLENKSFALYLRDPAIGSERRGAALKSIFAGRVNPLVMNTIGVMNNKGHLSNLGAMCDAYDDLLDQQLGKIEVDITVTAKLDVAELENVRGHISRSLKRDAVLHQYVDASIIGGMIIRVQDQLVDGSVRKQLEMMQKKLLAAKK